MHFYSTESPIVVTEGGGKESTVGVIGSGSKNRIRGVEGFKEAELKKGYDIREPERDIERREEVPKHDIPGIQRLNSGRHNDWTRGGGSQVRGGRGINANAILDYGI